MVSACGWCPPVQITWPRGASSRWATATTTAPRTTKRAPAPQKGAPRHAVFGRRRHRLPPPLHRRSCRGTPSTSPGQPTRAAPTPSTPHHVVPRRRRRRVDARGRRPCSRMERVRTPPRGRTRRPSKQGRADACGVGRSMHWGWRGRRGVLLIRALATAAEIGPSAWPGARARPPPSSAWLIGTTRSWGVGRHRACRLEAAVQQDPDRQPRRDRLPRHADRQAAQHPDGRRVQRG